MDDRKYFENRPPVPPEVPRPPRRRYWMALIAPLVVIAACVVLMLGLIKPDAQPARIPNTGQTTPAQASPSPRSPATLAPGSTYPVTAKGLLTTCLSSFQDFLSMEEAGAHMPGTMNSQDWRDQVNRAIQAYRSDCQTLGSLPPAPRAYAELERNLKLAAGEVAPVTDGFSAAVDQQQVGAYRAAMDHLDKFVEYANNAERILFGLDQKRVL